MIENEAQLNQTRLAINDLEAAMATLKRREHVATQPGYARNVGVV